MRNEKGFSLVELLVSIIVAAILILTTGVLSSIANRSYYKFNSEQQIYNDISYGFKLMQNKVRSAASMSKITTKPNPPWVNGEQLVIGTAAFGLYQAAGGTKRDFAYSANGTAETEAIFSVPDANLTLTIDSISAKSVTITLSGKKDTIPFTIKNTIMRRSQ